jgi:hypothetical protein
VVILPKKRGDSSKSKNMKTQGKDCANCGATLLLERRKVKAIYCDDVCRKQALKKRMEARRPTQFYCTSCGGKLDMLSRLPHEWAKKENHFCNSVCADAYRRATKQYQKMSQRGNASMLAYKEAHGHVKSYENRKEAVSENNRKAPPKAKYFQREGKVWGYTVKFFPNEDGDGYRASIAEFPDLIVHCKTMKEGLRLFRQKFIEGTILQGDDKAEQTG